MARITALPPRQFLCTTCQDSGAIKRPSGRRGEPEWIDACPDCTRNSELRYRGWKLAQGHDERGFHYPSPLEMAA